MTTWQTILVVLLWIFAMAVSYFWGAFRFLKVRGKIVIDESDDPQYYGKVYINFDDEIEDIARNKYVTLAIEDNISKKYSLHNGEPK